MNSNLFGLYAQVGAQVGALAKTNAETATARSARIAGLIQDGTRRWFDGVTASVGETARIVQDFGKVRSPADIAELQRAWLQTASARATENVRTFVELSQKLAAEVSAQAAEAQTLVAKVETPKAAPKIEAKPALKIEAKGEVPAAVAAPAPKAEAKKPAAKKTAAKPAQKAAAPKAEAPKAEVKPAPAAKVEAPAAAAPAPKAEAPKTEAVKAEAPKAEVKPAAPVAAPAAAPAPAAEAPKAEAKPAAKPTVAAE